MTDFEVESPGGRRVPFAQLDNAIMFAGRSDGIVLGRTDGNLAGTRPLATIPGGIARASLGVGANMAVFGDELYFFGGTPSDPSRVTLWRTDGTEDGTGTLDESPAGLFELVELIGGCRGLFFTTRLQPLDFDFWFSGGSSDGLEYLGGGRAPGTPNDVRYLTDVNGTTFFAGVDIDHGCQLWKSDGSPAGTRRVKDLPSSGFCDYDLGPQALSGSQNRLFFSHDDGAHGREPYVSNGSADGTVPLGDLNAAASRTLDAFPRASLGLHSESQQLEEHLLLLNAGDGSHGRLFATDGTDSGTVVLADREGLGGVTLSGRVIFIDAGHPGQIWRSDGTPDGTVPIHDFGQETFPDLLGRVRDVVLLVADDGIHGNELWRTDGTPAGTMLLADLNLTGDSSPHRLELVGNLGFFVATTDNTGFELWRTDGTTAGTQIVKEINPGRGGALDPSVSHIFAGGTGELYFTANISNGFELWRSDGSGSGTVRLTEYDSGPRAFGAYTVADGRLFFVGTDRETQVGELWTSDGTPAGTHPVRESSTQQVVRHPHDLIPVGGGSFFLADDGSSGEELWWSDGTSAHLVRDIKPGQASAFRVGDEPIYPGYAVVGGRLLFLADDGEHGVELWQSDGTEAGTSLVKDIERRPADPLKHPAYLTAFGSRLVFFADDGKSGFEPWISDGTPSGTRQLADIAPDALWSRSQFDTIGLPIARLGNDIVVAADDTTTGLELWSVPIPGEPFRCVGDCDASGRVTVEELLRGVRIGLGNSALASCEAIDVNGDRKVSINELVEAVSAALTGCD